ISLKVVVDEYLRYALALQVLAL
ncbi:hypothetical protein A2U01_0111562, partial [Trifolium medium]|nr:hypothetical protein [Trifolium medium]